MIFGGSFDEHSHSTEVNRKRVTNDSKPRSTPKPRSIGSVALSRWSHNSMTSLAKHPSRACAANGGEHVTCCSPYFARYLSNGYWRETVITRRFAVTSSPFAAGAECRTRQILRNRTRHA